MCRCRPTAMPGHGERRGFDSGWCRASTWASTTRRGQAAGFEGPKNCRRRCSIHGHRYLCVSAMWPKELQSRGRRPLARRVSLAQTGRLLWESRPGRRWTEDRGFEVATASTAFIENGFRLRPLQAVSIRRWRSKRPPLARARRAARSHPAHGPPLAVRGRQRNAKTFSKIRHASPILTYTACCIAVFRFLKRENRHFSATDEAVPLPIIA